MTQQTIDFASSSFVTQEINSRALHCGTLYVTLCSHTVKTVVLNTCWTRSKSRTCGHRYILQISDDSSPVRPHQVGQRLVSLTTPDANISRNNSQRASQKVTLSWRRTFEDQGIFMGAMRMAKKPVSSKRLSLRSRSLTHSNSGFWCAEVISH